MASKTEELDGEGEDPLTTAKSTETGMDSNVAGALSYVLGLVTGIVFYVIDDRPFVRHHAAQSIAFNVVVVVAYVALVVLQIVFGTVTASGTLTGFILGGIVSLGLLLLWLVIAVGAFATWVYLLYMAYQGNTPRIPLIGDIADKIH